VNLRHAPVLEFELDHSFDEAGHIDKLLDQVAAEDEQA